LSLGGTESGERCPSTVIENRTPVTTTISERVHCSLFQQRHGGFKESSKDIAKSMSSLISFSRKYRISFSGLVYVIILVSFRIVTMSWFHSGHAFIEKGSKNLRTRDFKKTGLNIAGDVVQGRNIKQAAKSRLKSTGENLLQKAMDTRWNFK
jgi:hypothetical protein